LHVCVSHADRCARGVPPGEIGSRSVSDANRADR
jgi:hypothetical protein